jgi:hypothetical protein
MIGVAHCRLLDVVFQLLEPVEDYFNPRNLRAKGGNSRLGGPPSHQLKAVNDRRNLLIASASLNL